MASKASQLFEFMQLSSLHVAIKCVIKRVILYRTLMICWCWWLNRRCILNWLILVQGYVVISLSLSLFVQITGQCKFFQVLLWWICVWLWSPPSISMLAAYFLILLHINVYILGVRLVSTSLDFFRIAPTTACFGRTNHQTYSFLRIISSILLCKLSTPTSSKLISS